MATNPESGAFRRILFAAGPHVLALALFAVLSVLFYGKVYDGYALKQPDIANWKGMYQEIADNQILTGEGTNWTGSLFGGMPTYQIGGSRSSVFNITGHLWTPVNSVFGSGDVASMWMGMVAAYLLALAFGVAPWMAMLAGAGFGLSSVNVLFNLSRSGEYAHHAMHKRHLVNLHSHTVLICRGCFTLFCQAIRNIIE